MNVYFIMTCGCPHLSRYKKKFYTISGLFIALSLIFTRPAYCESNIDQQSPNDHDPTTVKVGFANSTSAGEVIQPSAQRSEIPEYDTGKTHYDNPDTAYDLNNQYGQHIPGNDYDVHAFPYNPFTSFGGAINNVNNAYVNSRQYNGNHKGRLSNRIVQTRYGKLQGFVMTMEEHKFLKPVEVFLGVPYATPPVGSNRYVYL
jgi:Carboxylesterase family